jgi:hypothetical protein
VLRSQVEPAGQHAEQTGPAHAIVPAGQLNPRTSQVVGSRLELQRQAPLDDPDGQQVASLFAHGPLTQVHVPAAQMALSWQRLPQRPQLRAFVRVLTHLPPHLTFLPLQPRFPFPFFPLRLANPSCGQSTPRRRPSASPARTWTIRLREGGRTRERERASKR